MTPAILDTLRTLPRAIEAIPETVPFQKAFLALPSELQDHVCSFLVSPHGMPGVCNGLLPQWAWREVLLSGKCLPFLQDLDVGVVEAFCKQWEREHEHSNGGSSREEPNWELLVRRLSQEDWITWDMQTSSLKMPDGLRNRRRIWQLAQTQCSTVLFLAGRSQ